MKKILALLLAIVMVAGVMTLLTACGGKDGDNSSAAIPEGLEPNGNGSYSKFEYDEYGNVIRCYIYGSDYKLKSSKAYEYDESHKYIVREVDYDNKEQVQQQYTYERTAEGRILKQTRFDSTGRPTNVMTCEYNENQQVTAQNNFDGDGHLLNYERYEYDENGVLIKEIEYDGDGNMKYYKIFETDADGQVTEYWYTPDGKLFQKD